MSAQRVAEHEIIERMAMALNGNAGGTRPAGPRYRRFILLAFAVVAALVALIVGVPYVRDVMTHESTDDAFIDAHVVPIGPKVASHVSGVHVTDNQHVRAGDLLVELDPRDFEARLAQAQASLAVAVARHQGAAINVRVVDTTSGAGVQQAEAAVQTAERQVDAARSRLEEARAQVVAAEAEATRAAADLARYEELLSSGAVSRQERDNALATSRTGAAKLDAARQVTQAAADTLR
jgi:membrane fusion protein, multidrug efflux system